VHIPNSLLTINTFNLPASDRNKIHQCHHSIFKSKVHNTDVTSTLNHHPQVQMLTVNKACFHFIKLCSPPTFSNSNEPYNITLTRNI